MQFSVLLFPSLLIRVDGRRKGDVIQRNKHNIHHDQFKLLKRKVLQVCSRVSIYISSVLVLEDVNRWALKMQISESLSDFSASQSVGYTRINKQVIKQASKQPQRNSRCIENRCANPPQNHLTHHSPTRYPIYRNSTHMLYYMTISSN